MSEVMVQLSDREQEVLRLVATGATNQEIANTLNISINTVKVHLRNIFEKISVTTRTEATLYAVRHGLVEMEGRRVTPLPASLEVAELPSTLPRLDETEEAAITEESTHLPQPLPVQPPFQRDRRGSATPMSHTVLWPPRLLWIFAGVVAIIAVVGGVWQWRQHTTHAVAGSVEQAQQWQSRAMLTLPRNDFAVADYENRLYVIGGATANGVSDAVERYEPLTNTWVPLSMSNKPTPVTGVQAVMLGGRIYVPGGEQANGLVASTFEAYDPRNERWQKLPDLPAPRSRYALAKVEGKLYLFGGWDGTHYAADVWSYDPSVGRWDKHTSLPTPRRNAGAAVVDGLVYVVGGENASGPVPTNERYDPTSDGSGQPWTSAAPLPAPVGTPSLAAVVNELVIFDPERHAALQFTPANEKWSAINIPRNMPLSARSALLGTNLYIFGPATGPQPGVVSEYHVLTNTFLPLTIN